MSKESIPLLPGLEARLEQLLAVPGVTLAEPGGRAIAYFIRLRNGSGETVRLLARKWVLEADDGSVLVVEGDGLVGETPRLAPGEEFAYHSHHQIRCTTLARGIFFGLTDAGCRVRCELEPFRLEF